MTKPAIPNQAIDAYANGARAFADAQHAAGLPIPTPDVVRAGLAAAAPHIAAQTRAQVAKDLLNTANDERARPSRDCCSMAIEAAYRDAAENVTGEPLPPQQP